MSPHIKELLSSSSPSICLAHPTKDELQMITTLTASSWRGPLTSSQYQEESIYLLSAPLNKHKGMTHWILTTNERPNFRPILSSCETIRKPSTHSDKDTIIHGIASVYTDPLYRSHGYASRMLRDLGVVLRTHQSEFGTPIASILFSDIGPDFYARLSWIPFPSTHLTFLSLKRNDSFIMSSSTPLKIEDLPLLCNKQESLIRQKFAGDTTTKTRFALLPTYDAMAWHHHKESFLASKVYRRPADIKGAIAGRVGSRIWIIWTRFLHGELRDLNAGNKLYILTLCVEDESSDQTILVENLKAVLEAAQYEAAEWDLPVVELWNPSSFVERMVLKTEVKCEKVDRKEESICSLMWYGEGPGTPEELEWIVCERFGWC